MKAAERVIGWKRKWCTVNREFCEDGEVVRWRAIGHREGRCKGRIGRGDHKVEDMILVVCWEVYVLSSQ